MTTYQIAKQVSVHPKMFSVDYYQALQVQQYYGRHGIKVSVVRFDVMQHCIFKVS